MNLELVNVGSRSAVIKLSGYGLYHAKDAYDIYLNGQFFCSSIKVVTSLWKLKPNTEYLIYAVVNGSQTNTLFLKTDYEFITLNVRDFGAYGDGIHDDTNAIQAAIMSCPLNSRVQIPKGVYKVSSLFLKSDLNLHLDDGAVLSGCTDRERIPILPAVIENYDENDEYNLGSYGGNPADTFAALITGINVKNVSITGEGIIDGCAGFDNWWKEPKKRIIAWRPRLIFLNHCENIVLNGITVKNSPHWNIHPYFCKNVKCVDLKIINPQDSHNTDGFNPESCENVEIVGTYISVGDDCIAVKSGQIYMAKKNPVPTKHLLIQNCCMMDGHGAVTVGSENACGIYDVLVKDCEFIRTDRGLRIKTRRGRGEKSVIDHIEFDNIFMDGVMTPIVVNSFYFCGPYGQTEYVASKEPLPIDERTPYVKRLIFKNIKAVNCHVAAIYIYGLPERKIEEIILKNIDISFAEKAKEEYAAMMAGCEIGSKQGIKIVNAKLVDMQNIRVMGFVGEECCLEGVDMVNKE